MHSISPRSEPSISEPLISFSACAEGSLLFVKQLRSAEATASAWCLRLNDADLRHQSFCQFPLTFTRLPSFAAPKLESGGLRKRPSGSNLEQMGTVKSGSSQKSGSSDSALHGNPNIEENCRELVACIVTIGGIDELQTALHKHMPDQVRQIYNAC